MPSSIKEKLCFFSMSYYQILSVLKMFTCQGQFTKIPTIIAPTTIHKQAKVSLRKRPRLDSSIRSCASRGYQQIKGPQDRFGQFLEQHNHQLIQKCHATRDIVPEGEETVFGCFDRGVSGIKEESFMEKRQTHHRYATSTVSSSTGSGNNNLLHFSTHQSRQSVFNTHRILDNMLQQQQVTSERPWMPSTCFQSEVSGIFSGHRNEQTINQDWRVKSQLIPMINKKQKMSLRKGRNGLRDTISFNKKQSLNYEHLLCPLTLETVIPRKQSSGLRSTGLSKNTMVSQFDETKETMIANWMKDVGHTEERSHVEAKVLVQIQKDLPRTTIDQQIFPSELYKQYMKQILVSYCQLRPQINYVQGMNMIVSALICHTQSLNMSSCLFNHLMTGKGFENIYKNDFRMIQQLARHLGEELGRYSPNLYQHIVGCGVDLQIFTRGWYLSMLATIVPLSCMHLIIDKFMKKGFKGLNEIILTILIYLRQQLMSTQDPDDLVIQLSNSWMVERGKKIDWQELVSCSDNIALKPVQM